MALRRSHRRSGSSHLLSFRPGQHWDRPRLLRLPAQRRSWADQFGEWTGPTELRPALQERAWRLSTPQMLAEARFESVLPLVLRWTPAALVGGPLSTPLILVLLWCYANGESTKTRLCSAGQRRPRRGSRSLLARIGGDIPFWGDGDLQCVGVGVREVLRLGPAVVAGLRA